MDAMRTVMRRVIPAALGLTLVGSLLLTPPGTESATAGAAPPDVVLILTDDMRWDMLWAMPHVQEDLVDHGVRFTRAFVVNAWCCPSRTSILTGQYSHGTGVWKQQPPNGGFESFQDGSTIPTWLQGAGYQTGFVGKYLNGYEDPSYVPPGWDRWFAFTSNSGQGGYFDYEVSSDGEGRAYGSAASEYSVDVMGTEAVRFIQDAPAGQPLFLEWAPIAPHKPSTPAPRHEDAFADLPPWRPMNYNEPDASDKPLYVRKRNLSGDDLTEIDRLRLDQYRTLLAVDDGVSAIVDALEASGRLGTALIVFASDNGFLWGEHRWDTKLVAYEESIRIPLVVRYDPLVTAPRPDRHLVLNIDLAPTITAAAGLTAPGADGKSLLALLESSEGGFRPDFLIEHLQGLDGVPTYCAVRGKRYKYTEYDTGEEELYDVVEDPLEMVNRATDPVLAAVLGDMRARAAILCSPPPPGFTPRPG
jgi:arylsulfatase A-like enzyme